MNNRSRPRMARISRMTGWRSARSSTKKHHRNPSIEGLAPAVEQKNPVLLSRNQRVSFRRALVRGRCHAGCMKITRRSFLKQTVAASAVFPLFHIAWTKASGRVLGAYDVIRVGVAGIHGQGNAHIDQYLEIKNVQVTHLIDPDRSLFESRSQKIREKGGNTPKCFQEPGWPVRLRGSRPGAQHANGRL